MKILVTMQQGEARDTFFTPKSKEALSSIGEVIYNPYNRQYTEEELQEALKDIDCAVTAWGTLPFNEKVIEKANKMKILAHTGGSVAQIATEILYKKGIRVLSGNTVFAESVAEGCLCYILCALRRLEKYMNSARQGKWREYVFYNEGIMGRTIGIVGFGMISKYLIGMLKPFHVDIKVYSSHLTEKEAEKYVVKTASIDEIFETCDIISIHSALTPKTEKMIGKPQFQAMKNGSLLVNTARGAILDENALIEELKTGRIFAALDVFEKEPLTSDSPLCSLSNTILIPHMGGPTIDQRERVVLSLAKDIKKILNGETDLTTEISSGYAKNMTR